MATIVLYVFVFCILAPGEVVEGVSTNHIILITQPTQSQDSWFAYSHLFLPAAEFSTPSSIVVSAPNGNQYEHNEIRPGVVWKCFLGPKSANETCQQLALPGPQVLPDDPCYEKQCEWNDNGLLGMTLASDGRHRWLACAPKWQRTLIGVNPRLNGLCHFTSDVEPSKRVAPLTDPSLQLINRFPVYSWAQAGFSATFDGPQLVLGAPGFNGWNGTVIQYGPDASGKDTFHVLDLKILQHMFQIEYLGYAVTNGRYFEDGVSLIAAGAPRGSGLRGLVFVFEFPGTDDDDIWLPETSMEGDTLGGYFGSVMASGDVNGDGTDELIVGAPLRPRIDASGDIFAAGTSGFKTGTGEEGCIFVFTSKEVARAFGKPEIICGSRYRGARFGQAIAVLGDINDDGFQDLGVGAPFEDDEGALYIYHGEANFGLNRNLNPRLASQTIRPSADAGLVLKGFGSSVFGGVDSDSNGTPDIGIGAFKSEALMILRTRKNLPVENTIQLIVNGSIVNALEEGTSEFVCKICTTIGLGEDIQALKTELGYYQVDVEVTFDPNRKRYEVMGALLKDNIYSYRISDYGTILILALRMDLNHTEPLCTVWNIQKKLLDENDEPFPGDDFTEVNLAWEASYASSDAYDEVGTRKYVLTGNKFHVDGEDFDAFCALCPEDTPSKGVLTFPINPSCHDSCQANFDLQISFQHQNTPNDSKSWNVGSTPLELVLKIINFGQIAGTPTVEVRWIPHSLSFSHFEPFCTLNSTAGKTIQCSTGALSRKQSESIRLTLEPFYPRAKVTLLQISAVLSTPSQNVSDESENVKFSDGPETAEISLISEAALGYFKASTNTIFLNGRQSKSEFRQTFKMQLSGASGAEVDYSFWFPASFRNHILTSLYPPIGKGCEVKNHGHVLPYEESTDAEAMPNVVTCSTPEVTCLKVNCFGRRLNAAKLDEFTFRFSLDSRTIRKLMNESKAGFFEIQSKAEMTMFGVVHEAVATTTFQDPESAVLVAGYSRIPRFRFWILHFIAGVVCGVAAVAVVTYVLKKKGFFERKHKKKLKLLKDQIAERDWHYSPLFHGSRPGSDDESEPLKADPVIPEPKKVGIQLVAKEKPPIHTHIRILSYEESQK